MLNTKSITWSSPRRVQTSLLHRRTALNVLPLFPFWNVGPLLVKSYASREEIRLPLDGMCAALLAPHAQSEGLHVYKCQQIHVRRAASRRSYFAFAYGIARVASFQTHSTAAHNPAVVIRSTEVYLHSCLWGRGIETVTFKIVPLSRLYSENYAETRPKQSAGHPVPLIEIACALHHPAAPQTPTCTKLC